MIILLTEYFVFYVPGSVLRVLCTLFHLALAIGFEIVPAFQMTKAGTEKLSNVFKVPQKRLRPQEYNKTCNITEPYLTMKLFYFNGTVD